MQFTQNKSLEVLVLDLCDQRPSQYMLKGTEDDPNPIRLQAPGLYRLPSDSFIVEDVDGLPTRIEIRYIRGCDEIRVDRQEKMGRKPNYMNDTIWFKNGRLVVTNDAQERGLFNYIKACHYEKSAAHKPAGAQPKFEIFNPDIKARKNVASITKRKEATDLVAELITERNGKVIYDEARIDFLSNLFGVTAFTADTRLEALYALAEAQPEDFIRSIADKKNIYRAAIGEAMQLEVIDIKGSSALFTRSNPAKSFYEFRVKGKAERLEELVEFLLSQEGELAYKEMVIDSKAQKERLANSVS